MREYIAGQNGSAVVVALIAFIFFGVIIAGLLPLVSNEVRHMAQSRDGLEAQYAAEAGVKAVIAEMNDLTVTNPDWSWALNHTPVDFPASHPGDSVSQFRVTAITGVVVNYSGGSFPAQTITAGQAAKSGRYEIEVEATVNGATRKVKTQYDFFPAFKYALLSGGDVWEDYPVKKGGSPDINNGPNFYGEIGYKTLSGNAKGTKYYGPGGIDVTCDPDPGKDSAQVTAMLPQDQYPINPSTFVADYSGKAGSNTLPTAVESTSISKSAYYINGTATIKADSVTWGTGPVTLFVNGDVQFDSGTIRQDIIIVAKGKVQVNGGVKFTGNVTIHANSIENMDGSNTSSTCHFELWANQTVHFNGSADNNSVCIYSKGTAEVSTDCKIIGQIVAVGNIKVNGGSVTYDPGIFTKYGLRLDPLWRKG